MAFYYKWTDEYLESLDADTFSAYYASINVIEKQELLSRISASITPEMKPNKITEKVNRLQREIKSCFEVSISSVNAQYLASLKAKEMLDG